MHFGENCHRIRVVVKALDSGFIAQTNGVFNLSEATMLLEKNGKIAAITGNVSQTTTEPNFGITDMKASMKQIASAITGASLELNELTATYIALGRNEQEIGQTQSSVQMLLNQMQQATAEFQTAMDKAGISMQRLVQDGLVTTFQKINTALNETKITGRGSLWRQSGKHFPAIAGKCGRG